MSKQNNLWRLDLLEVEFLKTEPRYSRTKLLLKSKKRSSLLPNTKVQALAEIQSLKSDIFNKKLHSSLVKYTRSLKKIVNSVRASKKKPSEDEIKFIKGLDIEQITNIKIIKLIQTVYKIIPKKLQDDKEYKDSFRFIPSWIHDAIIDKSHKYNQSNFYNSLNQDEKNYYSKLMNHKEILNMTKIVENSLKIVIGSVQEKDVEKKDIEDVETSESESENDSDSEDADSEESDGDDQSEELSDNEENDHGNTTTDFNEDDFSQFDALVAGSEEEEEDDDEKNALDQSINYNEVTDTEPSDDEQEPESEPESEDEFFEAEPKKEKKDKKEKKEKKEKKDKKSKLLPDLDLATGYFSGGSDSEISEDEVVKKITKPQKKNRRGQRARQKIWEAKFKTNANHLKKEKEKQQKEREIRQKEYEERVAKREAKAKLEMEKTGANNVPLAKQRVFDGKFKPIEKTVSSTNSAGDKPKLHPSWEAKKKQEEALKKVKFEGKKIKF